LIAKSLAISKYLWYSLGMRLSEYAKKMGVSYTTVFRWWKAGKLDAYQLDTGTIIARDPATKAEALKVALYARVSEASQKEHVVRQLERLREYAVAKGYQVAKEVTEIASGLNDQRPKLMKLLLDPSVGTIIVEHKDRLTRFNYIDQLLTMQGRKLEVVFATDTNNELVDDFVAVITSMAARLYGRRNSKKRAEKVQKCIEQAMKEDIPDEGNEGLQN
jgi:predicted site-specific integrase-resolvase